MRVGVLQIGARRKATVRAALQVVALIGDLSNTVPAAIVGHDAVLDVQRTARAIEQTTTATGGRVVGECAIADVQRATRAVDQGTTAIARRVAGEGAITDARSKM